MHLRPSVLNYSDYRSFLKDHLSVQKSHNKRYSCGAWAQRLGLKATSTLTMILSGQRNPGPDLVEKLVEDLKLAGREASFFRELVQFDKYSKNGPEQAQKALRLAEIHPRKQFKGISLTTFQAISNWYYYAIRELVDLPDFREDLPWIKERLGFDLTQNQIRKAIQDLVQLGLLTRGDSGKLRYCNAVETDSDVPDEGIKKHHEQVLTLASQSLRTVQPKHREISGLTFTLSNKDLARAKEIIRQAQYDLAELGKNAGDHVYHVEMALFPMTKVKDLE